MKRVLAAVLVLLAASAAYGGDTSGYRFLGFSPDLKYCAFEIHGVLDGSGFAYSTIYLIDVDANDYAARPASFTGQDGESEEEVAGKAMEMAALKMRALSIDRANTGTRVEAAAGQGQGLDLADAGVSASLALIERSTGKENELGMSEKMFELDLMAGGRRIVLQKDAALPKGRSGAYSYSLAAAYVNGNKVAVFLSYERPGFEGPDVRQMIVTGALPR